MSRLRDFKGWDTTRTVLVAVCVAMLIWVWAEGESVSRERIPLLVRFASDAASEYIYRPEDPAWSGAVTIEVEGTPSTIAEARDLRGKELRLFAGLDGMPVEVGLAKAARLSEAIPSLAELRKLKIVVVSVDPPYATVEVRRMVSRELPLKVELARALVLDGEPSASPSTVTVRVPEAIAARFTDGVQPVAYVSEEELDRVRGDGARTVSATVRLPAALGQIEPVVITPQSVSVNLRIRREVDTLKLPAVPVWFSLPPTEDAGQWTVEVLDKFVSDVTVSGPADQVARIRSGGTAIKALIELSTDDLTKALQPQPARPAPGSETAPSVSGQAQPPTAPASGTIARQVMFLGLPPGVTVGAASPVARVRISRASKDRNVLP